MWNLWKKGKGGLKKHLLLINVRPSYIRIAQLKNGVLSHFHLENCFNPSYVGSIYRAQVTKKQPSLEACFVNLGSKKSAFLYMGKKNYNVFDDLTPPSSQPNPFFKKIKLGQQIMVQVVKDPLKSKNLRVSDKISLPGIYLVYLPGSPFHIGVSRRIEDIKTREKLIKQVRNLNPDSALIVRTKAQEVSERELRKDLENLKTRWKDIQEKYQARKTPGLVYSEMSFSRKMLRDFLTEEVDQILVDEEQMFLDLKSFLDQTMPKHKHKLSFYDGYQRSLFDKYDLESELKKLLSKKVTLKSGGFIVIEETEAAVVVDVNTGGFMGKNLPEENILKINREAVKEIALQLRLRNLGGIIIIDFIDMEIESSRQKVMEEFSQELKKDPVPTELFGLSELAVAQLTRKRISSSLLEKMCTPCSHCEGRGWVKKPDF